MEHKKKRDPIILIREKPQTQVYKIQISFHTLFLVQDITFSII